MGQFAKFGEQIRIHATLPEARPYHATQDRHREREGDSSGRRPIPSDKHLRFLTRLKASSLKASSESIEAIRDYDEGLNFQPDGKYFETPQQFEATTKALAISKLAQTHNALAYDAEAEQAAQKAVRLSDSLPQADRYLISALQAQITGGQEHDRAQARADKVGQRR